MYICIKKKKVFHKCLRHSVQENALIPHLDFNSSFSVFFHSYLITSVDVPKPCLSL